MNALPVNLIIKGLSLAMGIVACMLFYTSYDKSLKKRIKKMRSENHEITHEALRQKARMEYDTLLWPVIVAAAAVFLVALTCGLAQFAYITLNKTNLETMIEKRIDSNDQAVQTTAWTAEINDSFATINEKIENNTESLEELDEQLKETDQGDVFTLWNIYDEIHRLDTSLD